VRCVDGCNGAQLTVFACAKLGCCTIAKRGEGVVGRCSGCPQRETRPRSAKPTTTE
jgi:hypothetical protein